MYQVIKTKIADRNKQVKVFLKVAEYKTAEEALEAVKMMPDLYNQCFYDFTVVKA